METTTKQFSIRRTFKAPIDLVFEAFSTAEALQIWWGPVEAPIEVIKLDFRPNGVFHFKMKGKQISYGLFHYKEIERPTRIAWISSFANEKGQIIKPPFDNLDLPKLIHNNIVLSEAKGMTTLVLTSQPIEANANEKNAFYSIAKSMEQGFGGTFSQLEAYLTQIQQY